MGTLLYNKEPHNTKLQELKKHKNKKYLENYTASTSAHLHDTIQLLSSYGLRTMGQIHQRASRFHTYL